MDQPFTEQHEIVRQLERVLSSSVFRRAERSSAMLKFIVEETLAGRSDGLKEYTLGAEALRRGASFDPRADPVVRAEASRLRTRLDQYYETSGKADPVLLVLPKGSYVPQFTRRPLEARPTTNAPAAKPVLVQFAANPRIAWICAMIALAVASWLWVRPTTRGEQRLVQFEVELKSDERLADDVGTTVVLSPDGSRIVFVSRTSDGGTVLNTRRLDQPDVYRLEGTDGALEPFVSPDGRWVGFWAGGKLKKAPLDGGEPVVLCDATNMLGASWGDDDTIIAALDSTGRLWRIPSAGGIAEVAVDLTRESTLVRWPQILPGSRFVVYTAIAGAGADRATIEVQSIRGGDRKTLVQGGTFGRYVRDGYLTYVNQGTLYAVAFDPNTLRVGTAPVSMLEDVSYSPLFGYAQVDLSLAGTLVYLKGADSERTVVDWIDRSGVRTPLISKPGRYSWPRLSPDGRRLAITSNESGIATIAIHDVTTQEIRRVTTRPGDYTGLTWLSNRRLAFGGNRGLGWVQSHEPGETTSLTNGQSAQTPWSVARDGGRLAFYERNPETGFDLWTAPISGTDDAVSLGESEPFLRTRAIEVYPSFSPDGHWMAYASNESGAWEIYVRRFPDDGTKVRVSSTGGVVPRWSPKGNELFYRTDAQRLMVVAYKAQGASFTAGPPRPWSEHSFADTGVLPSFDVAPDGERVAALMPVARRNGQSANHATFMLNFADEVRRRVTAR
jgi:Tol biopolymer transport system component